jgi:hypothetical protein
MKIVYTLIISLLFCGEGVFAANAAAPAVGAPKTAAAPATPVTATAAASPAGAPTENFPAPPPLVNVPGPGSAPGPGAPNQRSGSIDFEDELVEGMNQNPFDSLTHVGRKDDREEGHLYHMKSNFKREIRQNAQEMGYVQ